MFDHQRNQTLKIELDGIEIFHNLVFGHPVEVAVVRIPLPGFLTAKGRLENFVRQSDVLGGPVSEQIVGEASPCARFVMDPSIVNLEDNRHLLTYTVRETPPKGSGAIHNKVGIQAIVAEELDNGQLDFDFSRDVIVIDDSTPDSMRNAGGLGNTIQLPDGAFMTPFSYPLIDPDILALADRKAYMKEEVFDYWASLQSTYSFRYKDIVRDDPVLSELHLRRNFSALFLYGQAANKGGIATAVVRWSSMRTG